MKFFMPSLYLPTHFLTLRVSFLVPWDDVADWLKTWALKSDRLGLIHSSNTYCAICTTTASYLTTHCLSLPICGKGILPCRTAVNGTADFIGHAYGSIWIEVCALEMITTLIMLCTLEWPGRQCHFWRAHVAKAGGILAFCSFIPTWHMKTQLCFVVVPSIQTRSTDRRNWSINLAVM